MEQLELEVIVVVAGLKERVELEVVVGWMEKLDWKKGWWLGKDQQLLPGHWCLQKHLCALALVWTSTAEDHGLLQVLRRNLSVLF